MMGGYVSNGMERCLHVTPRAQIATMSLSRCLCQSPFSTTPTMSQLSEQTDNQAVPSSSTTTPGAPSPAPPDASRIDPDPYLGSTVQLTSIRTNFPPRSPPIVISCGEIYERAAGLRMQSAPTSLEELFADCDQSISFWAPHYRGDGARIPLNSHEQIVQYQESLLDSYARFASRFTPSAARSPCIGFDVSLLPPIYRELFKGLKNNMTIMEYLAGPHFRCGVWTFDRSQRSSDHQRAETIPFQVKVFEKIALFGRVKATYELHGDSPLLSSLTFILDDVYRPERLKLVFPAEPPEFHRPPQPIPSSVDIIQCWLEEMCPTQLGSIFVALIAILAVVICNLKVNAVVLPNYQEQLIASAILLLIWLLFNVKDGWWGIRLHRCRLMKQRMGKFLRRVKMIKTRPAREPQPETVSHLSPQPDAAASDFI